MFVLRLNDYRVIIGLALVLLVLAGLLFFRLIVVEDYTLERLTKLTWGEGQGQLGQRSGIDGKVYGPRSFAVDEEGYIYVADTFNQRIVVLDPGGAWLTDFGFPGPDANADSLVAGSVRLLQDIAVDSERNIYVIDYGGTGVYRYDHVGNLLQTWPLNDESALAVAATSANELWVANRLDAVKPGRVIVGRTRISSDEYLRQVNRVDLDDEKSWSLASVTLTASSQAPWDDEVEPGQFHTFMSTRDGLLVTEEPAGPFARVVRAWQNDELRWEQTVDVSRFISDAALLGSDRQGRAYLGINLRAGDGTIYRLDERTANAVLRVTTGDDAPMNVQARVDDAGNVYVMHLSDDGVLFERARHSQRYVLVSRSVVATR